MSVQFSREDVHKLQKLSLCCRALAMVNAQREFIKASSCHPEKPYKVLGDQDETPVIAMPAVLKALVTARHYAPIVLVFSL